jgi:TolA protein
VRPDPPKATPPAEPTRAQQRRAEEQRAQERAQQQRAERQRDAERQRTAERQRVERQRAERAATERAAAEQARAERARADRAAATRAANERAAAERARAERAAAATRAANERAAAERARAERARAERARTGGDPLGDIAARTRNGTGRTPNPPAQQTAAEVRQSIRVAVDREIAPFWQRNVPSGVDVEQLRATLEIRLNRDGSIESIRQIGALEGRTDSNQPQQALFVERAIRSIRQAAPFNLPAEYYEQWQVVRQPFSARR